jgi:hypothetical protein
MSIVSTLALDLSTLNVAINGVPVLEKGYSSIPTFVIDDGYAVDGYVSTLLLKSTPSFLPSEKVRVLTAFGYSLSTEVIAQSSSDIKLGDKVDSSSLVTADGYITIISSTTSASITNASLFSPSTIGYLPWVYVTNSSGTISQEARVVSATGNEVTFDRELTLNIGDLIYNSPQLLEDSIPL